MINLIEVIENLIANENIITESFQSSILRDLVSTIDKSKYWNDQYLPRGVAWDKITDKDIIYGESNDEGFLKKYIRNSDYMILWFPLTSSVVASRYIGGSRRGVQEYTVVPGKLYITCGNEFVDYENNKSCWRSYTQVRCDLISLASLDRKKYPEQGEQESDISYHKRIGLNQPQDFAVQNVKVFKPSVRDYEGPLSGHLTVKKLEENTVCSCIAISKEVLTNYSTTLLMQRRWESKLNAVALLKKPINDYEVKKSRGQKTISWEDSNKFTTGMVDYPTIRELNMNHYRELLRGSTGIKFIRKYVDKCKTIVDAIDKYTQILSKKQKTTPEAIKNLTGDQFINIIFNTKNTGINFREITRNLTGLQSAYNNVVYYLNETVAYIQKGGDSDGSYHADCVEKYINEALGYVEELKKLA